MGLCADNHLASECAGLATQRKPARRSAAHTGLAAGQQPALSSWSLCSLTSTLRTSHERA
jgi:hypothetical protein